MNDENNKASFEDEESRNISRAEYGALLVVSGLTLEVVAVYLDLDPGITKWSVVVANVLITVGVMCEILFEGKARVATGKLKTISDKEVAEANARAEEARHETERLRSKFTWRSLGKDGAPKFVAALKGSRSNIEISHIIGDIESTAFSILLTAVFTEAGWGVRLVSTMSSGELAFGLVMPFPNQTAPDPRTDLISNALNSVGHGVGLGSVLQHGIASGTLYSPKHGIPLTTDTFISLYVGPAYMSAE